MPNPLLLPTATTSQVPLESAYTALNVPGIAAGGSYADPTTGVIVYKLTSPTFPEPTNTGGYIHDYAEGNHEVSLPHTGNTRSVLIRSRDTGTFYVIDFNPSTGVGNARPCTGNNIPTSDIRFTFSCNASTPQYAFVAHFNIIYRINHITMAEAPLPGVWPITHEDPSTPFSWPIWLHQSVNDEFFTWMLANTGIVAGYEPATATFKTRTITNMNEPRLDRAGRYIAAVMSLTNGMTVWDWLTDTITWTMPGDGGTAPFDNIPFAHQAMLSRRMMGVHYNNSFPGRYWVANLSVPFSHQWLSTQGAAPGDPEHTNGNWVQPSVAPDDQWALCNFYSNVGDIRPIDGFAWLAPGAMTFVNANGERRVLAHTYNGTLDGTRLAYAKCSPDGLYVLFTSNMNRQSRSDIFLATVPSDGSSVPSAPANFRFV